MEEIVGEIEGDGRTMVRPPITFGISPQKTFEINI